MIKTGWEAKVGETFVSFKTGEDPVSSQAETFVFEKVGTKFYTVGSLSGRNEYRLEGDEFGGKLQHATMANLYIYENDQGDFVWSNGYSSRLKQFVGRGSVSICYTFLFTKRVFTLM